MDHDPYAFPTERVIPCICLHFVLRSILTFSLVARAGSDRDVPDLLFWQTTTMDSGASFAVVTNFDDGYDVGFVCAAVNAAYRPGSFKEIPYWSIVA